MQRAQESESLLTNMQQSFSQAKRSTQEQMVSRMRLSKFVLSASITPKHCLSLRVNDFQIDFIGSVYFPKIAYRHHMTEIICIMILTIQHRKLPLLIVI